MKDLKKKVRRLEARLQAGPKKLARLKRKLAALTAAKARKAQKKAAARAVARQTVKPSTAPKKKNVKPATGTKSGAAEKKAKKRLNISPERRAQLSAAMKARWAAKRAAEANPPRMATSQDPALTPGM